MTEKERKRKKGLLYEDKYEENTKDNKKVAKSLTEFEEIIRN